MDSSPFRETLEPREVGANSSHSPPQQTWPFSDFGGEMVNLGAILETFGRPLDLFLCFWGV